MNKAMKSDNIMNLSSENYQNNGYIIKWVIKQIIIAYLIFLLLLLAIIVYNNSIQENKLNFNECLLLLRSFMIFELLFHKEILYILVDDPFDLLVQNLILGSYYIAFAVYLDLKIRYCYKTDIFINKNISPFIVGFCGVLTIFAIFAIFIIKSNTGYLSMRHLIYIIFSLCGQASHYIASKKASKYLAEKTVIAMLFLNITNFVMVSYELISRTSWRFNFSLEN